MPLTATHPAARADWLERHALPKAKKLGNDPIKFMPMADLIGVSRNTFKKWLREEVAGIGESGVYQGGEQGVPYAFKPLATVEFIIKHFRSLAAERAETTRQMVQTIAGEDAGEAPAMSLLEIRQALDVKERMNKLRLQQGELVKRDTVEQAIAAMIDEMTNAQITAQQEQDPTGQWPPEMAQAFREAQETIMLGMQKAGERCIQRLRARPAGN
jgi:hypothetical protein